MIEILRDHWLLLLVGQYPEGPLGGLAMTLVISLLTIVLVIPVSILFSLALVSHKPALQRWSQRASDVIRGIPLLMFIFWIYFGLPLLLKRPVNGFAAMTVALVIYQSAYVAEVLRAGFEAIPRGQSEAAHTLGLGYWNRSLFVLLPQAAATMAPSLILKISSIIKDTSVAYIISTPELTFAAGQLNGVLIVQPLQVFGILALGYFFLCAALNGIAGVCERRFAHFGAR